jgi:hypothetical protein
MRTICASALLCLFLTACANQQAAQPYPAAGHPQQVVANMEATRQKAAADNKLAMYILGANWCHDSTDFAALLKDPAVAPIIKQGYNVQFINVGYLQYIREYVSLYEVPVIYTTPTVMVVEPHSNTLLNRASLPYWGAASSGQPQDVIDYFGQFSTGTPPPHPTPASPQLQRALNSINLYEREQAQRIYTAYAELGVLMKAMDAGQPSQEFNKKWGNLANMRSALPPALKDLRQSARAQDALGITDIELRFPHYALFTDRAR